MYQRLVDLTPEFNAAAADPSKPAGGDCGLSEKPYDPEPEGDGPEKTKPRHRSCKRDLDRER